MTPTEPRHLRGPSFQPSAFTLVETLIVIAIIGLLVQLILPAISAAREAARRTQCASHLRQWTLAMQNYESALHSLPVASMRSPDPKELEGENDKSNGDEDLVIPTLGPTGNRQSWPPKLWAYVEASALAEQYDFDKAFYLPPNIVPKTLEGVCATPIPLYYCPSDRGSPAFVTHDEFWRVRANYVVSWGPKPFQTLPAAPNFDIRAPFGFRDNFSRHKPFVARYKDIVDGTSTTLLMSEAIMHPIDNVWDQRGDILNDDGGGGLFMTLQGPNGKEGDSLKLGGYCHAEPMLPCRQAQGDWKQMRFSIQMAARSWHRGGVNATFCDGGIRFIADDINLKLWQDLSTINGEEIVSPP